MQGVKAAVRGTAVAAQEIASMTMPRSERGEDIKRVGGVEDLASAMVDLKTYEYQAQGGVAVIKAADEMVGTLTDELV
jgi:hypothetical protein